MFDYLKGILTEIYNNDNPAITIDISGCGYYVFVTQKDLISLPEINSNIKVFTILIHKEDNMTLYGFITKEAREIFKILTSVSGVGPKMAMQLLNEFNPSDIANLVAQGDYKSLTKTKGVGPKLAQKIILELKGKFDNIIISDSFSTVHNSHADSDAQALLISFGYDKKEIDDALAYAYKFADKKNDTEDILKFALKFLSKDL